MQRLHKKRSYIDSRYHPVIDSWIEKVTQETTQDNNAYIQRADELGNDLEKIRNIMDRVKEKIDQSSHIAYTTLFNQFLKEAVWENAKDQGSSQVLKTIAVFMHTLEKTISIMDVIAEKHNRLPSDALKEAITTVTHIREDKIENMFSDFGKLNSHLDRVILAIKSTQESIVYLPSAALQQKAQELLERVCATTSKGPKPLENFELTAHRLTDKFKTLKNRIDDANKKISHAEFKDIFDGLWKKVLKTLASDKNFDAMIAEVGAFTRSIKEIKLTIGSIKENINRLPDHQQRTVSHYLDDTLKEELNIVGMLMQLNKLRYRLEIIETIPSAIFSDSSHFTAIFTAWNDLDISLVKQSAEILKQIHALNKVWPHQHVHAILSLYLLADTGKDREIHARYEAFLNLMTQPEYAELKEFADYVPYRRYLKGKIGNEVLERSLYNCKLLKELGKDYPGLLTEFKGSKVLELIIASHQLTQFLEIISQENSNEWDKSAVVSLCGHYLNGIKANKANDKGKEKEELTVQKDKLVDALSVLMEIRIVSNKWPKLIEQTSVLQTEKMLVSAYLRFSPFAPGHAQRYKDLLEFIQTHPVLDSQLVSILCLCHVVGVKLSLLKDIVQFSQTYPEVAKQGNLQDAAIICNHVEFYTQFFNLINKMEYAILSKKFFSDAALHGLKSYFIRGSRETQAIANMEAILDKAVTVQKKANVLAAAFNSDDENTYGPYFDSLAFNQATNDRREIMQYLHHDWLENDPLFKQRCFAYYDRLAHQSLNLAADPQHKMNNRFQGLIDFSKEIKQVARHPFAASGENQLLMPMSQPKENKTKNAFDHNEIKAFHFFFQKQKQIYHGFSRATRHTGFLDSLSMLHRQTRIRDDYYKRSLQSISEAQERILADDYKYNQEHYFFKRKESRLYKICNDILLAISRKYLLDDNIPQNQKADFFEEFLGKQLCFHLNYLKKYLTADQSRKFDDLRGVVNQCIQTDTSGQVKVNNLDALPQLSAGIGALKDRNQVPAHLNYLIENLSNLLYLSNEGSKQQPKKRSNKYKPRTASDSSLSSSSLSSDDGAAAPRKIGLNNRGRSR